MVNECPVCRERINAVVFMLKRSAWRCGGCGSLLGVDKARRFLALIPFAAVTLMASLFLTRSGWGDYAAVPVALIVWLPIFLPFDRALVLERHGFHCRQCGYDLRGQVKPCCPECGREFDPAETAQMQLSDPSAIVEFHKRRRSVLLRLVPWLLVIVLLGGVIAQVVWFTKTTAQRVASSPTTAPTPAREAGGSP